MNHKERGPHQPEAEETSLPDLPDPSSSQNDKQPVQAEEASAEQEQKETIENQKKENQNPENQTEEDQKEPEKPASVHQPSRARKVPDWLKNPWMLALIPALGCLIWVVAELVRVQLFSLLEIGLVLGAGLLLIAAAILLLHYLDGYFVRIVGLLLCAIVCVCSFNGEQRCNEIMVSIQQSARHTDTIHRTLGLYTTKEVPVASIQALEDADIGVLASRSQNDASAFAKDLMDADGVTIKQVSYPTMDSLIKALKGQAVRAVFLSSEDISLASAFPGMENLKNELTLVRDFSVDTGLRNESIPVNMHSEPFTILLSASSSSLDQESYRSLLTAVVTVNPKTRTALSVFLPRNLKTQYACPPELECITEEDKLGLSSLFSIEALKETVSTLLDTDINYTIRVDLETLVSMMDFDDPVLVNNETEYSSGNYTFKEGEQEMNPAMARAYYRELNDFSAADNDYQHNPGALLDAVVEKLRSQGSLKDVKSLENLARAVHTNMSYSELCAFLQMFCLHPIPCEVLETELTGTAQWQNSPTLGAPANMVEADSASLEDVRQAIAAIREGSTPDLSSPASQNTQTEEGAGDQENQEEKPLDENENPDTQEDPNAQENPNTQENPDADQAADPDTQEVPVWDQQVPVEDPGYDPGYDDQGGWSEPWQGDSTEWAEPGADGGDDWPYDESGQETGW